MAGLKRDVDRVIRQLRRPEFGCEVSTTSRGHWKVTKTGCQPVIISPQPCDPKSIRNAKADLKRYLGILL